MVLQTPPLVSPALANFVMAEPLFAERKGWDVTDAYLSDPFCCFDLLTPRRIPSQRTKTQPRRIALSIFRARDIVGDPQLGIAHVDMTTGDPIKVLALQPVAVDDADNLATHNPGAKKFSILHKTGDSTILTVTPGNSRQYQEDPKTYTGNYVLTASGRLFANELRMEVTNTGSGSGSGSGLGSGLATAKNLLNSAIIYENHAMDWTVFKMRATALLATYTYISVLVRDGDLFEHPIGSPYVRIFFGTHGNMEEGVVIEKDVGKNNSFQILAFDGRRHVQIAFPCVDQVTDREYGEVSYNGANLHERILTLAVTEELRQKLFFGKTPEGKINI